MRQRSSLICGNRLAPSPLVKLSAAISEVSWYVNLIPLLDIWCNQSALTLMWWVVHAVSDPFRAIWIAAALSLDTSVSQLVLIISEITIEMFFPCLFNSWIASSCSWAIAAACCSSFWACRRACASSCSCLSWAVCSCWYSRLVSCNLDAKDCTWALLDWHRA